MRSNTLVKATVFMILLLILLLSFFALDKIAIPSSSSAPETTEAIPTLGNITADAVICIEESVSHPEINCDVIWKNNRYVVSENNLLPIDRSIALSHNQICRYSLIQNENGSFAFFSAEIQDTESAELLCSRILIYRKYFPIILVGDVSDSAAELLSEVAALTRVSVGSVSIFTANADIESQDQSLLLQFKPCERSMDLQKKKIALTFDDGPHATHTVEIINTLKQHGAVATFYVNGTHVKAYPDLIRIAFEEGNEIGNHTNLHEYFSENTPSIIRKTVEETNETIRSVIGIGAFTVRPPGGECADRNGNPVKIGYPLVLWSIDTFDYTVGQTSESILHNVNSARDGDIILMHDVHEITADTIESILVYLSDNGFQTVTVSELLEFSKDGLFADTVYNKAK